MEIKDNEDYSAVWDFNKKKVDKDDLTDPWKTTFNNAELERKKLEKLNETTLESIKTKSIGKGKTSTKNKKKKHLSGVQKFIIASLVTLTIAGGIKYTPKISERIAYNKEVTTLSESLEERVENYLIENNLATRSQDGKFTLNDNSVEEYRRLGLNMPETLYGYYLVMSGSPEFSKLIEATQYRSATGATYYYTDTRQFLNINGYNNFDEFENYCENGIYTISQTGDKSGYFDRYEPNINVLAEHKGGIKK